MLRALPTLIFFASGACGLAYELVWFRMLGGLMGTTLHATSATLAAFMGGMAIGAYACGRYLSRQQQRHPLAIYGAIEIGVGLYALALPSLLGFIDGAYVHLAGSVSSPSVLTALRFALAIIVVGVPAAGIGALFPGIIKAHTVRPGRLRRASGRLYAANTLGATVGVLATGLLLLPALGVRASNTIAAVSNVVIGVGALALCRAKSTRLVGAKASNKKRPGGSIALVIAALSGLTALAYELVWFRALRLMTINTTVAFAIVLAVFLTGIALGSSLTTRSFSRKRAWTLLGGAQVMVAASALLTPHLLRGLDAIWGRASGPAASLVTLMIVGGVTMLLPATLLGASLPLAIGLYGRAAGNVSMGAGAGYAANTVGAVAGAILTGVVLIPTVGSHHTLLVLAALNVLASRLALTRSKERDSLHAPAARWAVAAVVFLAAVLVFWRGDPFSSPRTEDGITIMRVEDASGLVEVREKSGRLALIVDRVNRWGTTTQLMVRSMQQQGYLPLLLHSAPKRVVEIGLATGIQMVPFLRDERVEHVVAVEISPAIVQAAKRFAPHNQGLVEHPKAEVVVADGRHWLRTTAQRFDIIVLGLFTPYRPGAGSLFSRELYQVCRARSTEGGITVHWLPLNQLSLEALRAIMGAFVSTFDESHAFIKAQYLALVGWRGDADVSFATIAKTLERPAIAGETTRLRLGDPHGWLAGYALGNEQIRAFAGSVGSSTVDRPIAELTYDPAREQGYVNAATNLDALLEQRQSPTKWLAAADEATNRTHRRYFEARGFALRAAIAQVRRQPARAAALLRRAAKLNPAEEIIRSYQR